MANIKITTNISSEEDLNKVYFRLNGIANEINEEYGKSKIQPNSKEMGKSLSTPSQEQDGFYEVA